MKRENMMLTEAWTKYCVKYNGEEHNFPYFTCHLRSKETPFLSSSFECIHGEAEDKIGVTVLQGICAGFVL